MTPLSELYPLRQPSGTVQVCIPYSSRHPRGIGGLKLLFESIKSQTYKDIVKVAVADNSEDPECQYFCNENGMEYLDRPSDKFDAAWLRNESSEGDSDFILWCDQDTILHNNYVYAGLCVIDAHKSFNGRDCTFASERYETKFWWRSIKPMTRSDAGIRAIFTHTEPARYYDQISNNLLVSRKAFENAGPWWEVFRDWGFEDWEWSYRARKRGVDHLKCSMDLCAHLWHERAPGTNPYKMDNDGFYENFSAMYLRHRMKTGIKNMRGVGDKGLYRFLLNQSHAPTPTGDNYFVKVDDDGFDIDGGLHDFSESCAKAHDDNMKVILDFTDSELPRTEERMMDAMAIWIGACDADAFIFGVKPAMAKNLQLWASTFKKGVEVS